MRGPSLPGRSENRRSWGLRLEGPEQGPVRRWGSVGPASRTGVGVEAPRVIPESVAGVRRRGVTNVDILP